ncbi:hypothetical protein FRB91_010419 [Serendipita sp. 411]|nr:hypothetical protein FRC15_001919 [Serendipita sp. 397]KAG8780596.1 hypothetical protein FRC16_003090 [Serendipita sp. 398]KAG8815191.1 hypothetical protein FRC19_001204 [Serendipita sp. 401]KAG8816056.1 hypothetical protein FRC18_001197 [Serendipita sp. 400]KAG8840069.1 hypothetical protein FRC20_005807 [Serendipita sp. 405]KAG8848899.1 hypothetical protein FRB91_010419 [Serendipita sp. 411]KAG9042234.1 hypothetical protein FS842_002252 [Serendipita sp. 407]
MFRASIRLFQVAKQTTGIAGLAVHPDPLPALKQTFNATLVELQTLPAASSYRQATEAITRSRLKIVEGAQGDIQKVEQAIGGGQIEEILDAAGDELKLVSTMSKMAPWEPLEEKPAPAQWKYFGEETSN